MSRSPSPADDEIVHPTRTREGQREREHLRTHGHSRSLTVTHGHSRSLTVTHGHSRQPQALFMNINAAKGLFDVMKTNLGPKVRFEPLS